MYDMSGETYYFRGQKNSAYDLIPSICHSMNNSTYLSIEKDLILEATLKYSNIFCNYNCNLELLTQLQHYGVPTRLMDVTLNPLVALYFACLPSSNEADGEVFVFTLGNEYLSLRKEINVLASIGFIEQNYPIDFDRYMLNSGIEEILSPNGHTSNYELLQVICETPILIRQQYFFERQKAQSGRYILFFNRLNHGEHYVDGFSTSCGAYFDNIIDPIPRNSHIVRAIIKIPSKCKENILLQLKHVNVDESTLFPEDVDKGCKMLVKDLKNRHTL